MKDKDVVLDGINTRFSSEVRNVWDNGYAHGYLDGKQVGQQHWYDEGIKAGAELAAMHGSDATSQQLEKSFWEGVDVGAEKGWEAARMVILDECLGGIASDDVKRKIFDNAAPRFVLQTWKVKDVLEKIRFYQGLMEDKQIHVGDEVVFADDEPKILKGVVISENGKCLDVMWSDGVVGSGFYPGELKKTGRSFPQIADVRAALSDVKDALSKEEGE